MKSIFDILSEACLNEAHIGDLKNVQYIHHYTTLNGLNAIIRDRYIEARESFGDSDWYGYNLKNSKVVSFHDSRYDPELELLKKANLEKRNLDDTKTLGLHRKEICAMIEYNFDWLPNKIKEKTDFIRILEKIVPEFCEMWNKICFVHSIVDKLKGYATISTIIEELEKIGTDYAFDIAGELETSWSHAPGSGQSIVVDLFKRNKLKEYSKSDEKELLESAIRDDKYAVKKIMYNHGYEEDDISHPYFMKIAYFSQHDTFINYADKRFFKGKDYSEVEIRIACNMPINVGGCTIHFFKGTADYINENFGMNSTESYEDFVKKLCKNPFVMIHENGLKYKSIR